MRGQSAGRRNAAVLGVLLVVAATALSAGGETFSSTEHIQGLVSARNQLRTALSAYLQAEQARLQDLAAVLARTTTSPPTATSPTDNEAAAMLTAGDQLLILTDTDRTITSALELLRRAEENQHGLRGSELNHGPPSVLNPTHPHAPRHLARMARAQNALLV